MTRLERSLIIEHPPQASGYVAIVSRITLIAPGRMISAASRCLAAASFRRLGLAARGPNDSHRVPGSLKPGWTATGP